MQETIFRQGRIGFHHKNDGNTSHDIFVSPNFTASHYEHHSGNVVIASLSLKSALSQITYNGVDTTLHFESAVGGTFTVTLRDLTPESLCDAVEAARLQAIEAGRE